MRLRAHHLPFVLLLGGLAPLVFALVAQYGFGQPPCHLCLLQRYPYVLVAACGIGLWLWPQQRYLLCAFAVIGWLTTGAIGVYHTGVEQGWFNYRGGCVASTEPVATLDALRQQIMQAPRVSCDQPMASFLSLSMASWNSISALIWIFIALTCYRRRAP